MINLNGIEIKGFVIHSEDFMKDQDAYTQKLKNLLIKYREHIIENEGITYLNEQYRTEYLSVDEMDYIKNL